MLDKSLLSEMSQPIIHAIIITFVLTGYYVIITVALFEYSCIVLTIVLACRDGRLGADRSSIATCSAGGTGAGLAVPRLLLENPDDTKRHTGWWMVG